MLSVITQIAEILDAESEKELARQLPLHSHDTNKSITTYPSHPNSQHFEEDLDISSLTDELKAHFSTLVADQEAEATIETDAGVSQQCPVLLRCLLSNVFLR